MYNNYGQPTLAEEHLEQAIEAYSNSSDGLYYKGETAFDMGRWEDAQRYFDLYKSSSNPNARSMYQIGEKLRKVGDCERAVPFFESSLALEPEQSDTITSLGRCALQQGDLRKAAQIFEKLPNTSWGLSEVGRVYVDYGYDSLAIPYFQKALFSNPNLIDTNLEPFEMRELTQALKAAGEVDKLQTIAKDLLALCPRTDGCFGIHSALAKAYKEVEQPLLRLSHLEQASRLRPGTGNATTIYEQLAETLIGLGEPRRALDYYQKAANLSPDPGASLYSYAEYAKGMRALGLSQQLFSLSAEYSHRRRLDAQIAGATLLYSLGERQESINALKKIALTENSAEAWERVAQELLILQEDKLGAEALKEGIINGNPSLSSTLAATLLSLGEKEHALFIVEGYLQTSPATKELLPVAQVFVDAGAPERALQIYAQVIAQQVPETTAAFQRGAALLLKQPEIGSLDEWSDRYLAAGVDPAKTLIEIAKVFAQAKREADAKEFFLRATPFITAENTLLDVFDRLLNINAPDSAREVLQRFAYLKPNTALILARAAERAPFELARELLEEALQISPEKRELWEEKGKLFAKNQQPIIASEAFIKALALSPNPRGYADEIITVLCDHGAFEEAESFLAHVQDPPTREFLAASIKIHKSKDPGPALSKALLASPTKLTTNQTARLALIGGWPSITQKIFQESPFEFSTETVSLWIDATLFQEQYDLAPIMEKATKNARTFSERQELLQQLLNRGEATSVLPLARVLRNERPWDLKSLKLFVRALAATAPSGWEGEALLAAQQYNAAQTMEENSLDAASLMWEVGALNAAQTLYESVISQNAKHSEALFALAKIKLASGNINSARPLLERAIAASASPALLWVSIGDLYRDARLFELSLEAYQSANKQGNQTKALWIKLAEIRLLSGDLGGTKEALTEATSRSKSEDQTFASFVISMRAKHGNEVTEELLQLLVSAPTSPEKETALLVIKAMSDERKITTEELSPNLQKEARDALTPEAFNSPEPPQETLQIFWEPRADLWKYATSRWEEKPSQQELLSVWSEALCAPNEAFLKRCQSIIKNTASSYLLSLSAADLAQKNDSTRLAKLSLRLSPLAGSNAYQELLIEALQRGDKTSAAQLASEWRSVALASGVEVPRALYFFALISTDSSLQRAALFQASNTLTPLVKKFSSPGTFPVEK
jgi:tetratricopeptide (TPR) repeat protein